LPPVLPSDIFPSVFPTNILYEFSEIRRMNYLFSSGPSRDCWYNTLRQATTTSFNEISSSSFIVLFNAMNYAVKKAPFKKLRMNLGSHFAFSITSMCSHNDPMKCEMRPHLGSLRRRWPWKHSFPNCVKRLKNVHASWHHSESKCAVSCALGRR
jgi:hypothetical protein